MRRFVLVSYDISNPKRLRKMYKLMRGYGEHIQLSVFICQLTEKDKIILTEKIADIIHKREDQVILVNLGSVEGKRESLPAHWKIIGAALTISDNSLMIY